MLGTDITLKHQVAVARYQDFLAEARRQQAIESAFGENRRPRRSGIAEARAALATLLLRAGAWLMPEEPCSAQAGRALELRPGR